MIETEIGIISELSSSAAKILLVLGMVFIILKVIDKKLANQSISAFYEGKKLLLYHLHINGTKLATVLAIVHGFTATPVDQSSVLTGWLLGIIMLVLMALGAVISIRNNSKPMDGEKNHEWRTIRIIKWVLTLTGFLVLVLHVL
ncbi:MAG: hypothetical protein ACFFD4_35060 [Candidatus Odinarchaeota archaeon]